MIPSAATGDSTIETVRAPLIGPLVTGAPRRRSGPVPVNVAIPPLRVGIPAPAASGEGAPAPPSIGAGWRDDSPGFSIGEAEPEDELALLHLDRTYLAASGPSAHPMPYRTALADLPDTAHLEEIAARLEGIARILREEGSAAPLLGPGRDPLGALITGYLVGYYEGTGSRAGDAAG
jgi:hypothetical protein